MAEIRYHAVPADWRKEEKYAFLEKTSSVAAVKWQQLKPDKKGTWVTNATDDEFGEFLPIGIRDEKGAANPTAVFSTYCRGITSSRDDWVFSFQTRSLAEKVGRLIENYNSEVARFRKRSKRNVSADDFVRKDPSFVKWTDRLKNALADDKELDFDQGLIRNVLYRPFTRMHVYFDDLLIHRRYLQPQFFAAPSSEKENRVVCLTDVGGRSPFSVLAANRIVDLHLAASTDTFQCFPLFTYFEDGKERRDNVTPKALTLFQIFYADDAITREDIFHYVYAILHHPFYRTRYAENLKRELPRIPFVGCSGGLRPPKSPEKKSDGHRPTLQPQFFPLSAIEKMQGDSKPDHDPKASAKLFHTFAAAGKKLAELHVNYESAKEFPLERKENKEVPLDWRVEKMKLSKDKASLIYNDFLTLSGIPPEVFDYRLGNRSALDWVIDQYRVKRDEHGNITSDPNRLDDEQYIVRLIAQVITVSLETMKVVKELPEIEKA